MCREWNKSYNKIQTKNLKGVFTMKRYELLSLASECLNIPKDELELALDEMIEWGLIDNNTFEVLENDMWMALEVILTNTLKEGDLK